MIDATEATKLADEIADYREMSDAPVYSGKQVANILQHWADRATAQPTDAGMREEIAKLLRGAFNSGFNEGTREHNTFHGGKGWEEKGTAYLSKLDALLSALPVAGTTRRDDLICEFMPLGLLPLADPNFEHGDNIVVDADGARRFTISGTRENAERVVATLNAVDSALGATSSPAPSGWKLVPIKPTQAMMDADAYPAVHETRRNLWDAMLAAAPPDGANSSEGK